MLCLGLGKIYDLPHHTIFFAGVFTPQTWQDMTIQFGATFNLAHSLNQMLCFRPRNKFEELDCCCISRRHGAALQPPRRVAARDAPLHRRVREVGVNDAQP